MDRPPPGPRPPWSAPAPLAQHLTQGGDERIVAGDEPGPTRYGVAAYPRPGALEWSTCTASSPSLRGWAAAADLLERLRSAEGAGHLALALDRAAEEIRARLRAAFALPACEIVLAASGTDAQLLAPLWACGPVAGPLSIVAVAPDELGRGSPSALTGRAPFHLTPAGRTLRPGAPIDGFPSARLLPVPARDQDGGLRPTAEVDGDVSAAVERALARGDHVLVHAVAASKTGLAGPSTLVLDEAVARGAGRVRVIVDAAQGRFSPEAPAGWLARGRLVVVSGSKFFGGPAFSGALLVPPGEIPPAPAGLGEYLAAPEVPASWTPWRTRARRDGGLGLLLRWQAALPDLEAFARLPAGERAGRAARLAGVLRAAAAACPVTDGVEEHAGIVTFGVVAGGRRLPGAALKHLKDDLALPGPGAARPIVIGEPTVLGADGAGLRVAVGAPQILRAAAPEAWAALAEEIGQIFAALARAVQALDRFSGSMIL